MQNVDLFINNIRSTCGFCLHNYQQKIKIQKHQLKFISVNFFTLVFEIDPNKILWSMYS